jgi:transposase
MATAYSDDLRRKLLQAHDEGEGTLQELAEIFRVSYGWALKISAARGKTGKMERQPGAKRGPVSKITPEIQAFIKGAVTAKPDSTLAELQQKLFEEKQLEVSIGRLWAVLNEMNLRFKKKPASGRAGLAAGPGRKGKVAIERRRH